MKDLIEKALLAQCRKSVDAANLACYVRQKKRQEYQKVTGIAAKTVSGRMAIWDLGNQFNPYFVKRHADTYSRRLEKVITANSYEPQPCLNIEIPKDSGKKRTISQYTVVDAALSCWVYESLLKKNLAKLSKFAFAFRRDLNSTDAVEMIAKRIRGKARTFCVEIDFKNCFDAIDHKYLMQVLDFNFNISPQERHMITAFLKGRYARGKEHYEKGTFKPRHSGIPQGSTVSLFLANAVFYELDKALENLNVTFARYADDILVLSDTYDAANSAAQFIADFSSKSGIPINFGKSGGISLISPISGEIKTKPHFDFLGYQISANEVRLSSRRKHTIKKTISEIINRRLLLHPRKGDLNKKRFYGGTDWDLVVCVNELRRRIYGRSLTEEDVIGEIKHGTASPRSLVSAHPLVNTNKDYVELDGWLQGCLRRALIQRAALVKKLKVKGIVTPDRRILTTGTWYKNKEISQDTRLPSLTRAWSYARRLLEKRGSKAFESGYEGY
jgi:hypothetical protein